MSCQGCLNYSWQKCPSCVQKEYNEYLEKEETMTCKNCDCKETKPYVEGAMQCVDCDEIFNNILCPSCTAPKPATDKEIADVAREYVARILMPDGNATTETHWAINQKLRELVNRGK